jgi:hypothetical protein
MTLFSCGNWNLQIEFEVDSKERKADKGTSKMKWEKMLKGNA